MINSTYDLQKETWTDLVSKLTPLREWKEAMDLCLLEGLSCKAVAKRSWPNCHSGWPTGCVRPASTAAKPARGSREGLLTSDEGGTAAPCT